MPSNITIPKVIRKVQEKKFGRTWRWIWITVASIAIIVIWLMISGMAPWPIRIFIYAFIIAYTIFFFKFLKNDETLERTILMWKYFIRSINGQTIVPKYTCTVPFLQQVVPIVAVHKNGVIEFTGKRWGVLFRIDPSRISDDDLDTHLMKVTDIVDSLFSDLVLKTFVCSRSDMAKPIEQHLINSINNPAKSQEQKAHLHSIYQELRGNTRPLIEWQFYVFASIGLHPDINDAERARQAHIPGLENRMRVAGMHVVQMTDPDDIAISYRQCMTQVKI